MVHAQARHAGEIHLREGRRSHGGQQDHAAEADLDLREDDYDHDYDQALTGSCSFESKLRAPAERVSAGVSFLLQCGSRLYAAISGHKGPSHIFNHRSRWEISGAISRRFG